MKLFLIPIICGFCAISNQCQTTRERIAPGEPVPEGSTYLSGFRVGAEGVPGSLATGVVLEPPQPAGKNPVE